MLKFVLSVCVALALLAHCPTTSFADLVFGNDITGQKPSSSNPYTDGQSVNSHVTVSGITHGTGVSPNNAADRYNLSGWESATLNTNDYIGFTITPNSGYKIDFSSFIYTAQTTGSGPTSFALRSSLDGFTSDIGTPTGSGTTINLSAFSDITSSISFHLFAWNAKNSSGMFSVDSFSFNGSVLSANTVSAVPEPTSLILGSIAAVGSFGAWRRRRAASRL